VAVVAAAACSASSAQAACPTLTFDPPGNQTQPGAPLGQFDVGQPTGDITITVSGAQLPQGQHYSWSLGNGTLPPGLTWTTRSSTAAGLNDQLVISGDPTDSGSDTAAAGSYDFSFVVTFSGSCVGQGEWWNIPTGFAPQATTAPSIEEFSAYWLCNAGVWRTPIRVALSSPGYAWFRGDTRIASGAQYVPQAADGGSQLTCHVTESNSFGSTTASSLPVNVPCPTPLPDGHCTKLVVRQTVLPAIEGFPLNWEITVTNTGPGTANGVQVVDQLVGLLKPVHNGAPSITASQGSCSSNSPSFDCTLGDLAPGASAKLTLHSDALPVSDATLTNDVQASASNAASVTNQRSVEVARTDLKVTRVSFKGWSDLDSLGGRLLPIETARNQAKFAPGERAVVVITVTNVGLPISSPAYVTLTAPDGSIRNHQFIGPLPGGASETIELVVIWPDSAEQWAASVAGSDGRTSRAIFDVPVVRPQDPADVRLSPSAISGDVQLQDTYKVEPPGLPAQEVQTAVTPLSSLVVNAHSHQCRWLASLRGRFGRRASTHGICNSPIWLTARGKRHWSLHLRRPLPRGRYIVYIRVIDTAGVYDPIFSASHDSRFVLRVR
jgi:hypothetical protein